MTICIAGISEHSKIIGITDKMLTLSTTPITKYEISENNKAIKLNDKVIGLFAGDVISANEILNLALGTIDPADTVEVVAQKVNEAYRAYWQSVIDNFLTRKYMLTFDVFMKNHNNLNAELVNEVTKMLMQYTIDVEIIIAGVDTEPHLFLVNNLGTVINRDSIGYACIGSGSQHATLSLIESEYNSGIKMDSGLYALIEAKKRAEYDPGVGTLCDLVLINADLKILTDKQISSIMKLYSEGVSKIDKIVEEYADKIVKETEDVKPKSK